MTKTKEIRSRVTDNQKRVIKGLADEANITTSDFLRCLISEYLYKVAQNEEDYE